MFYNKNKNNDRINALSNALSSRTNNDVRITPFQPSVMGGSSSNNTSDNTLEGMGNLLKGAGKLYKGFQNSGLFSNGENVGSGIFSNAADSYINGTSGTGSLISDAANSYVSGGGDVGGSALSGAISTEAGGSTAGGFGGSVPWAAIGKGVKLGFNGIFDKKDENGYDDYSDLEESIVYPLQGAATGSMFGPWGALGGALYGLGYSFKDDLGLKNNEWYTDLLFPIGMGDEHQGLGISL